MTSSVPSQKGERMCHVPGWTATIPLSTEWSSLFDPEIQSITGLVRLYDAVRRTAEGTSTTHRSSVGLPVCPVLLAMYIKYRCLVELCRSASPTCDVNDIAMATIDEIEYHFSVGKCESVVAKDMLLYVIRRHATEPTQHTERQPNNKRVITVMILASFVSLITAVFVRLLTDQNPHLITPVLGVMFLCLFLTR